jgi:hypothetical protein
MGAKGNVLKVEKYKGGQKKVNVSPMNEGIVRRQQAGEKRQLGGGKLK